jgi:hypothetical protein
MRVRPALVVLLFVMAGVPLTAHAQSAQRMSIQASGLFLQLYGNDFEGTDPGYGFEAQLRYTPSAWSFGAGFQYTTHGIENSPDRATLVGGFIEPRYVFSTGSASVFPYLSGRFYVVKFTSENSDTDIRVTTTGLAGNGGGGVLVRLSTRMNLDLGATFGYFKFNEFTFENLGTGIEGTSEGGNGTNLVGRVGLTFGL